MTAFFESFRRVCGYKFPPLGRRANDLFFRLAPREIETELNGC